MFDRNRARLFAVTVILGIFCFGTSSFMCTPDAGAAVYLKNKMDGGNSPGTYEPDPEDRRRPDDHGGPYNEPGSDDDRRGGGNDHGGPYNEPGSDGGPY